MCAPRGAAGRGLQLGLRAACGPRRSCTALYEAAPPAVGPTGTTGRVRAAEATRRRMHTSAPPAAGPFGNSGPRAGRRSCVTRSGPARLCMRISAPPAAGPARGPWAESGPEELRDSEWSRGCRRDTATVCFQYLLPQVTVSDDSTYCSELALVHSGGHGNGHKAIVLFTSWYSSLSLRRRTR